MGGQGKDLQCERNYRRAGSESTVRMSLWEGGARNYSDNIIKGGRGWDLERKCNNGRAGLGSTVKT